MKHARWIRLPACAAALIVFCAIFCSPAPAAPAAPPPSSRLASDAVAGEVPASRPAAGGLSFLHLLSRGGWAMLPLAACSLLGLAIIIERSLALRRSQTLPARFMPGLDKIYQSVKDTEPGLAYCREHPSTIARIMAAGIRHLPDGFRAAEQAISDAGATEVARLRRNLRLLNGIAALAPVLGLMGTVWGMIRAFEGASRVGLGRGEALTTGIYEALVTTLTGLMIAAPALLAYYIFMGIIDRTVIDLNDTVQAFLDRRSRPAADASPDLIEQRVEA